MSRFQFKSDTSHRFLFLEGNRISLISKKNIRYEGTLYSINEANATVALQNVRSYGTEGREKTDPETSYVAPQDAVHPYLLFRGCDIKDLHVHEAAAEEPPAEDPAIVSTGAPPAADLPAAPPPPAPMPAPPPPPAPKAAPLSALPVKQNTKEEKENQNGDKPHQQQQSQESERVAGVQNRKPKKQNHANQVGTGASLLNRKARGTKEGGRLFMLPSIHWQIVFFLYYCLILFALVGPEAPDNEFDFQTKLKEFDRESGGYEDDDEDAAGDESPAAYDKDDFFDSISCDAIDRENGVDNRLRGKQERNLNTETFGAVALNSRRRRGRGARGGGGGRGPGRGREGVGGRGRGRSAGRGRGGRGRGRYSNGYQNSTNNKVSASA